MGEAASETKVTWPKFRDDLDEGLRTMATVKVIDLQDKV